MGLERLLYRLNKAKSSISDEKEGRIVLRTRLVRTSLASPWDTKGFQSYYKDGRRSGLTKQIWSTKNLNAPYRRKLLTIRGVF